MPLSSWLVRTILPATTGEGSNVLARGNRYGDAFMVPILTQPNAQAVEGSRYVVTNPTMGTGVAGAITTAFADTSALCGIVNGASAGGKDIILDYLKMQYTVAPTSATAAQIAVTIDSGARSVAAGTLLTPVNPNMNIANATVASTVRFGAVTAAAATGAKRIVVRDAIRTGIPVVGDEVFINFGAMDSPAGPVSGAAANILAVPVGPVVIGPGHTVLIHTWHPANVTTGPSFEFEMGWIER